MICIWKEYIFGSQKFCSFMHIFALRFLCEKLSLRDHIFAWLARFRKTQIFFPSDQNLLSTMVDRYFIKSLSFSSSGHFLSFADLRFSQISGQKSPCLRASFKSVRSNLMAKKTWILFPLFLVSWETRHLVWKKGINQVEAILIVFAAKRIVTRNIESSFWWMKIVRRIFLIECLSFMLQAP